MVVRVLMLIHRKSGLTPQQFQKHYEEIHMPLTKEVAGETFPISHIRRYIPRSVSPQDSSTEKKQYSAVVAWGNPADVEIDCVTELIFRDKKHLQSYFEMPHAPGAAARLEAEAENFAEKYTTIIVEECRETLGMSKL
ncbi:uncharacterized protein F4822DRAFT_156581 [Hypoxylon trugodes]|uniref:uncharacterized protein n=1 Tax=Hypoxylon trugodes TaxID=326681 RepID=UPI00218DE5EB|nr:uncharacterized protein F4822DRAFT_156581 [Hypoxylon trugodes]KAI1390638.1 hypothetical protein F4822DRAFT_156581 [Hypoxylon trugodes]